MKKQIAKNNIQSDFNEAILDFEYYINTQLDVYDELEQKAIDEEEDSKKSNLIKVKDELLKHLNLIVQWIKQWLEYLKFEKNFKPSDLKRYNYGEIIFANLGFNVGQEFGGPHYAIVLNKHDIKAKGVITIVPLSSLKDKNKNKLGDRLYLGNVLKKTIQDKLSNDLNKLHSKIDSTLKEYNNKKITQETFLSRIKYYQKKMEHNKALQSQLSKINNETIALTNQITTISKMRIWNPKTPDDSLANVIIPKTTMNMILEKIHKLYG